MVLCGPGSETSEAFRAAGVRGAWEGAGVLLGLWKSGPRRVTFKSQHGRACCTAKGNKKQRGRAALPASHSTPDANWENGSPLVHLVSPPPPRHGRRGVGWGWGWGEAAFPTASDLSCGLGGETPGREPGLAGPRPASGRGSRRGGGGDVSELSRICLEIRRKSLAKQEAVSLGLTRNRIAVTLN